MNWIQNNGQNYLKIIYAPSDTFGSQSFTKFGSLASESAHHANKFFKRKRIRHDLMFNKSKESIERLSSQSLRNLNKLTNWLIGYSRNARSMVNPLRICFWKLHIKKIRKSFWGQNFSFRKSLTRKTPSKDQNQGPNFV